MKLNSLFFLCISSSSSPPSSCPFIYPSIVLSLSFSLSPCPVLSFPHPNLPALSLFVASSIPSLSASSICVSLLQWSNKQKNSRYWPVLIVYFPPAFTQFILRLCLLEFWLIKLKSSFMTHFKFKFMPLYEVHWNLKTLKALRYGILQQTWLTVTDITMVVFQLGCPIGAQKTGGEMKKKWSCFQWVLNSPGVTAANLARQHNLPSPSGLRQVPICSAPV